MASFLAVNGGTPVRETNLPYGKQTIDANDIAEVVTCMTDPYLTTGPRVRKFEEDVCNYTGAKYGVAVCNGTAALHVAVNAAGITKGDEVIVADVTFVASANSVVYEGATVVFADIDPDTLNIDVESVESLVTPKTKAIIAVDMCGQPVDLDPLLDIARRHGLTLIEDASHALGASYKGRKVGSVADLTTLSFHPVKNITTGEGGMVVTNNEEFYNRMCIFRSHGINRDYRAREKQASHRYDMVSLGYNYRITDLQCGLGSSQLKKIDDFVKRRNEISDMYDEAFAKFDTINPVVNIAGVVNAHHLYVIKIDLDRLSCDRDAFYVALRKENIGVNVHYMPVHAHAYYQNNFDGQYPLDTTCPKAMATYKRMISLPCFPLMTDNDVKDVIAAVAKISNAYTKTSQQVSVQPGSLAEGEIRPIEKITNFKNSDTYRNEIHQLIPGGAHTYSKGDDQFQNVRLRQ